jgi:hypothetical protein
MARLLGHRQTKGAATDKPDLLPPRHISTLPILLKNSISADDEKTVGVMSREPHIELGGYVDESMSLRTLSH